MNKPTIIFLNYSFNFGGIERDILNQVKILQSEGYTCELCLQQNAGNFITKLPHGIQVSATNTSDIIKTGIALRKVFQKTPGATVIVNQYKLACSAIIAKITTRTSTRIIYREPSLPRSNLNQYALTKYYRIALKLADTIVVQSAFARNQMISLGLKPSKITICNNIPPETHAATPIRINPVPNLVCIGRLSKEKGQVRLIQAMPSILNLYPGAKLTIVGDGPLMPALQQSIIELNLGNSVELTGYSADPLQMLRNADILVIPSHWEGIPNVMLEALAVGVRIVATPGSGGRNKKSPRDGAMAEILKNIGLERGIIREDDFERSLVHAIEQMLALSQKEWNTCLDSYHTKYSYETAKTAFLRLIRGATHES